MSPFFILGIAVGMVLQILLTYFVEAFWPGTPVLPRKKRRR